MKTKWVNVAARWPPSPLTANKIRLHSAFRNCRIKRPFLFFQDARTTHITRQLFPENLEFTVHTILSEPPFTCSTTLRWHEPTWACLKEAIATSPALSGLSTHSPPPGVHSWYVFLQPPWKNVGQVIGLISPVKLYSTTSNGFHKATAGF